MMHYSKTGAIPLIATLWVVCGSLFSQDVAKASTTSSKIEAGLDLAVKWKWWVTPPDGAEWGMQLLPETPDAPDPTIAPPVVRPETYEVIKGDAIIKIARKFDMSAAQLMQFNGLTSDRIIIGQILRIPTPEQVLTMMPPPKAKIVGKNETEKPSEVPETYQEYIARVELENLRLQVFLDREIFSPGMIDGKSGRTLQTMAELYLDSHPDVADSEQLKIKASEAIKQPYTSYVLRREDFKFIKLPKDEPEKARVDKSTPSKKKNSKSDKAAPVPEPPAVTIDELMAEGFLAYADAWEFVSERFHCDEAYLHHINPHLKESPLAGSEFQVPNVVPFEIETILETPSQPAADPDKPVTAAVVELSRLEISQGDKLIAVMPLTMARPGLRGRNKWTVLNAIPRPRLATKREPREASVEKFITDPPLETELFLAPGPNNPVGILWINLAKDRSTDPLPYGLHGTSIPEKMNLEGIGGLRLTNWDIVRAARLMPEGSTLLWKAR